MVNLGYLVNLFHPYMEGYCEGGGICIFRIIKGVPLTEVVMGAWGRFTTSTRFTIDRAERGSRRPAASPAMLLAFVSGVTPELRRRLTPIGRHDLRGLLDGLRCLAENSGELG